MGWLWQHPGRDGELTQPLLKKKKKKITALLGKTCKSLYLNSVASAPVSRWRWRRAHPARVTGWYAKRRKQRWWIKSQRKGDLVSRNDCWRTLSDTRRSAGPSCLRGSHLLNLHPPCPHPPARPQAAGRGKGAASRAARQQTQDFDERAGICGAAPTRVGKHGSEASALQINH